MSNSLVRIIYAGTLVLGLATLVAPSGFAQHRPPSGGLGGGNTPTVTDRDMGRDRTQDRQTRTTATNTNSNGVNATDRDFGRDRAQDRMSQPGLDNNKVGAPVIADRDARGDARSTAARARVEADGYKNVQGLSKGSDGLWHGRAMRGSTEVPVTVDARGNVSTRESSQTAWRRSKDSS